MRALLTDKQKLVYGFVREFLQENGFPPTVQEVQRNFNFKSKNCASTYLRILKDKGYITRNNSTGVKSRNLQLVDAVIKVHSIDSKDLSNAIGKLKERGYKISMADAVELLTILSIRIE